MYTHTQSLSLSSPGLPSAVEETKLVSHSPGPNPAYPTEEYGVVDEEGPSACSNQAHPWQAFLSKACRANEVCHTFRQPPALPKMSPRSLARRPEGSCNTKGHRQDGLAWLGSALLAVCERKLTRRWPCVDLSPDSTHRQIIGRFLSLTIRLHTHCRLFLHALRLGRGHIQFALSSWYTALP